MVFSPELKCHISDEEIIEKYLRPKVFGEPSGIPSFIVELGEELYTIEPWLLPHVTDLILNPREWFFFGKRKRKYLQSEGVHGEGVWVAVECCHALWSDETGEEIGRTSRFRYYYRNKDDETSDMEMTNWFMREYRLFNTSTRTFYPGRQVLCKITCNDRNFV